MISQPQTIELRPQGGPQERFLSTPADIAVYGGAAGGGKSWALLFEPLRHMHTTGFGATIFRRTHPQIVAQGGLWSESLELYPRLGGKPNISDTRWAFSSGAEVKFAHLQHEKNVIDYQGSQIALIGFDELTHFTEYQFTYLLSRNRSVCGVRPYVRATCNPDAASWVKRWVEWYIDPSTGYAIPERSGVVRWFARIAGQLEWGSSKADLLERFPDAKPKSFTFIPARLEDNRILMDRDPGYAANIAAQGNVEQERLGKGNWNIVAAEGEWPAEYFGPKLWAAELPPRDQWQLCTIAWDPSKGVDAKFGDYSALVVLIRTYDGRLYAVAHMGKWHVEQGIDQLLDLCQHYRPDGVSIETNQFQQLITVLLRKRCDELGVVTPPVYEIVNKVDKDVRIRRLGTYLRDGTLRLIVDYTGSRILAEQLMAFPNGEHDDGPDALEMALRLMIDMCYERK